MSRARSLALGAAGLTAAALIATGASAVSARSAGRATRGTVYAAVTHVVGKIQYAAGTSTDKVLGPTAVTFALSVGTGTKPGTATLKGTVTVFTRTGALRGTDTVDLAVTSSGLVFSNGKLNLTHGTGGQRGHSFVGTFSGTGKSATGPFVFPYKGVYK